MRLLLTFCICGNCRKIVGFCLCFILKERAIFVVMNYGVAYDPALKYIG